MAGLVLNHKKEMNPVFSTTYHISQVSIDFAAHESICGMLGTHFDL